jgi:hypothetical protein
VQSGWFSGGWFVVRQPRGGRGMTDLALAGGTFAGCPRGAVARASRVATERRGPHQVVRQLWGRDRHGRFRTHGRDSVGTVRGTRWLTADRCDGTLTVVTRGAVAVRARGARRAVRVTAGHRLLVAHR